MSKADDAAVNPVPSITSAGGSGCSASTLIYRTESKAEPEPPEQPAANGSQSAVVDVEPALAPLKLVPIAASATEKKAVEEPGV